MAKITATDRRFHVCPLRCRFRSGSAADGHGTPRSFSSLAIPALGASFVASVRSTAERHGVTEVRYFGDLDLSGIRIPARAAAVAREHGLPPVRPATRLYDALLTLGRPAPSRETCSAERAQSHLSWLAPHLRPLTGTLLAGGQRLAQEWVGVRHLRAADEWHQDLR